MLHPFPFPRLAAVLLVAGALTAQQNHVAFPQDTTTGAWGNLAPLGHNASGGGAEARYQMLIPAAYLPSTGGTILALEIAAHPGFFGASSTTYTSLRVTMSHLVSAATMPALSPTFAANLPAPQVVFAVTNHTISYPPGQWFPLTLQQPFVLNGQDHLVIEFQKVVTPPIVGDLYMVTSRDERTDLPAPQVRLGTSGSGAATATTATATAFPLRMRLVFAGDAPTTVVRSPSVGGVYFGIGTTVDIETYGAPLMPMWLAFDFATPLLGGRTSWTTPAVQGRGWVVPGPALAVTPLTFLPAAGPHQVPLAIPPAPAFVGLSIVLQSITYDPLLGLQWSAATDLTIR